MITNDRLKRTPTRRMLTVAGFATIACSLIISIGPAMAAAGGNGAGNGGTVKIHDATTSLDAGLVGNEPWVCSFWVGFYSDGAEVGTWDLRSAAPTGDGSVVGSGTYDTSGDGVDATSTLSFGNGHYRLEWAANGSNGKQKTFWVACEAAPVSDEATPSDDATPSEDAAPSDESAPSQDEAPPSEDETPPSDIGSPSDDAAPSDEPPPRDEEGTPSDEETPTDEASPSDEQAPGDESLPSDDEVPTDDSTPGDESDPEGGASSEDVPPSDEQSPSSDEDSVPSDDESTPDDQSPAESSGDPDQGGQQPEGEVKAGTSRTDDGSDHASQSGGIGNGSMPDTALTSRDLHTGLGGILAAIGVLLIVIAHAGTRRERHLPTA